MPKISEFYGIIIKMFWKDHNWPHFHAFYSGEKAEYQVNPLRQLKGRRFPERANRLVMKWAKLHLKDLLMEWDVLSQGLPEFWIEGLE